MGRKKKYKSIENYKLELSKIKNLIESIHTIIKFSEKFLEIDALKNKAEELKQLFSEYSLDFGKEKIDSIYELGFIRLFASFEAFMYEYLKELYIRYPNSLPTDRKIQISDILEWKTKKSIQDYIIDHLAIENSYDHITWEKTLKNSFGIVAFENENYRTAFDTLNLCRNMIAHSSGKTNSKIMKDFKKIKKDTDVTKSIFKTEKIDIFDKELFDLLIALTTEITNNLEKKQCLTTAIAHAPQPTGC